MAILTFDQVALDASDPPDMNISANDPAPPHNHPRTLPDLEDLPPPYVDRAKMHRIFNISACDFSTVKAVVGDGGESSHSGHSVPMLSQSRRASAEDDTGSVSTASYEVVEEEEEETEIDEDAVDSMEHLPVLARFVDERVKAHKAETWMGIAAACAVGALVGSATTIWATLYSSSSSSSSGH